MNESQQHQEDDLEFSERQRLAELEERYAKLYEWAKNQEFITVFRAEGDQSWKTNRSLAPELVGSWYTERWSLIESRYKAEIEEQSGKPAHVFALIVPKSVLEGREAIDKGMSQVNIINPELADGKQEIQSPSEAIQPTLDNYLNQFSFIKEYRTLKAKYK